MPLLTTTPASIKKPSMAIMEMGLPVSHKARRPPVKARGMVNMTIKGDKRLWNWATIIR